MTGVLVDGLVGSDCKGVGRASTNRQEFVELGKWVMKCQGRPRRWDQYQEWPGRYFAECLDRGAFGDDTAILIPIHWMAIMSRSSNPFVEAWGSFYSQSSQEHLACTASVTRGSFCSTHGKREGIEADGHGTCSLATTKL
ncbi:hypothetical protein PMIN03_004892 [Paraphaeosphaeria minitans]